MRTAVEEQPHPAFAPFGDLGLGGGGEAPVDRLDEVPVGEDQIAAVEHLVEFGDAGVCPAHGPQRGAVARVLRARIRRRRGVLRRNPDGRDPVSLPLDQIRRNATKVLKIASKKYPRALLVLVGPLDTMPMTSPFALMTGPPELPCSAVASV